MGVLPGAEPYEADGGPVAVLLCHGFTGTPQSLRPWAEQLAAAGLTVSLPLLPGHGTRWQDLNATRWTDWFDTIEHAYLRLRERGAEVFVAGLSMGGTLALRLAEVHPDGLAGVILVNPSLGTQRREAAILPLLRWVVPSVAGIASDIKKPDTAELAYDRTPLQGMYQLRRLWQLTRADLGRVTAPLLVFRSRVDHVVEPLSGRLLREGCAGTELTERILDDSYHVATLDNDAPLIVAETEAWIRTHSTVEGSTGAEAGTTAG